MSATLPPSGLPSAPAEGEGEPASAAQRLAESRERMRQWMLQTDGGHRARQRAAAAAAAGEPPAWLDRLRGHPIVGTVVDAVHAWWANHPLHPAVSLGTSVVRDAIAPLARRHPLAVVTGAFAVGGALAYFRPWRWIAKPALFAGLASQIVTRFVMQVPLDSLLNALGSFAEPRPHDGAVGNGQDSSADAAPPAAAAPVPMPTEQRPTVH